MHTSANLVDVILLTCRCYHHYEGNHKKDSKIHLRHFRRHNSDHTKVDNLKIKQKMKLTMVLDKGLVYSKL